MKSGGKIRLKSGESAFFPDLPAGLSYIVTETAEVGYISGVPRFDGCIAPGLNEVSFISRKDGGAALSDKNPAGVNASPVTERDRVRKAPPARSARVKPKAEDHNSPDVANRTAKWLFVLSAGILCVCAVSAAGRLRKRKRRF